MRESENSSEMFMSMAAIKKECDKYYYAMHECNLKIQESKLNPIAFATENLIYHQAIKTPETREFQKAIIK